MGFAIIAAVGIEMWKYTREHPDKLAKKKNKEILAQMEEDKKHEENRKAS